jgi:transglutaminase-like putative cysteine protease
MSKLGERNLGAAHLLSFLLIIALGVPAPLFLKTAYETPDVGVEGGVFDVRVGPTPRSGDIVLGLLYVTIPENMLGKVRLIIESNARDLVTGRKQNIWLELWNGKIGAEEDTWWVNRRKLAQSSEESPRISYVPLIYREMTLAVVWVKSPDLDTITVRVNVTASPIVIVETKPTIYDVLLENSVTPESPIFEKIVLSLNKDPVKIFEYVRNNVFFDAYWGLLRGGLRTYYDMYGNSLDQSSLLVSLLRTAGYPARFAYGIVRVPTKTLAENLGLRDTKAGLEGAVWIHRVAGLLYHNDQDSSMLYHVWVRAYVNGTWIDMDPSFKRVVRKIDSPVTLSATPSSTDTSFAKAFSIYLQPLSDLPLYDISRGVWIVEERGVRGPPGEYTLLGLYSSLPEEFRGFITVYYPKWSDARGYDFAWGNYSFTLPTSALGAYRLTARFIPASKQAADYIASRPDGLSGIRINDRKVLLRPQFLLNGLVISQGDAALPGYWLPIKMKFKVTLPDGYTFIGWGEESLMGYAAYVVDFMKTRAYGEIGVEGARGSLLALLNPKLTSGIDKDEVVGRILYLQTRRYQIERWHQIERIWSFRHIAHVFPLNIHKAEYYQLINDGGNLVIGPPMFGAGIGWNSWAYYVVLDPEDGVLSKSEGRPVSIKELHPSTIPSYLPGSFYEGEVVAAIHNTVPYSTVHTFLYAASKGMKIIHVNRENLSSMPNSIPRWIRDGISRIADEWKGVEFNAFMPELPVNPDVLSIFVDDDPNTKPPEIKLAGEMFGVLTVMPLSKYHAAVGGLIYNLGRGVELGGGALASTEQGSYTARTEGRETGSSYSETTSTRTTSADEIVLENSAQTGKTDELNQQLEELKKQLQSIDPNDPRYTDILYKYLELAEELRRELSAAVTDLVKATFAAELAWKVINNQIPIFLNPDGIPMEVTDLVKYLENMGVDRETRLKVILNQREAIQRANTLGYIELPYEINGETVVMRLNYKYKLEVLTSAGIKFTSEWSSMTDAQNAVKYYDDLKDSTKSISFALSSVEIIPQNPITVNYKVQGGLIESTTTKSIEIDKITLTPEQLGGGFALNAIVDLYTNIKSLNNVVLNDWKYERANLPGGYEAKPLYEFWNLSETQIQKIEGELKQGMLPSDPPFIEMWLENPIGEFAGFNPDIGYGFGLNLLTYSGVGSKPKHLAVYGVWPGIYYLNVVGTKKEGVDGYVRISYKSGGFEEAVSIPFKVQFGELVKIPIIVDRWQRITVEEARPGIRISAGEDVFVGRVGRQLEISGKILDQFGREGVSGAKVMATFTSPDGSIQNLEEGVTLPDGSFKLKVTPALAGLHYITVVASADGYYPSTKTILVVVHGNLRVLNDLSIPKDLLNAYLKVKDGTKQLEIPVDSEMALPVGRYVLSIKAKSSEKWQITPMKEMEIETYLEKEYSLRLSEFLSAKVLIDVSTDTGSVEGGGWYRVGDKATLTAIPPPDGKYQFVGWKGDIESTQNPLIVQVDRPLTLRAQWKPVVEQTQQTTTTLITAKTTTTHKEDTTTTPDLTTTYRSGQTWQQDSMLMLLVVAAFVAALLGLLIIIRRKSLKGVRPGKGPATA